MESAGSEQIDEEQGNVLIYLTTGLETDATAISGLGGIYRHYLNHWHEALFASAWEVVAAEGVS